MDLSNRKWTELWPEGAPLATGVSDEDVPAIKAYLVQGQGRGAVIVCPGGSYGMRADHEGEPHESETSVKQRRSPAFPSLMTSV